MATYNCAIKIWRNDTNPADLRVNFRNQELSRSGSLLLFGFDLGALYLIPKNDAFPMKLYTGSRVFR
jgi:hypothetical protein